MQFLLRITQTMRRLLLERRRSVRTTSHMPRRALLCIEPLEARLVPSTYTFYGFVSAIWADPKNWRDLDDAPGVPSAGDAVIIKNAKVEVDANAAASSIQMKSGGLTVDTGTALTVTNGVTMDYTSLGTEVGPGSQALVLGALNVGGDLTVTNNSESIVDGSVDAGGAVNIYNSAHPGIARR